MVNILDCGSKTGSCVCSGLGLLGEAGHGKFDSVYTYSTDRQASGCEKTKDPRSRLGEAQSEVPKDPLESGSDSRGTTDTTGCCRRASSVSLGCMRCLGHLRCCPMSQKS